jgi:ABC-type transport system substrate-binding protein/DNA-binding CsgD family transcriptional regulator
VKTAPLKLTQRESEVAGLVARGLSNREIAHKLFISERTAEYHVEQIRNKLGFHSRSQIAAWVGDVGTQPNGDRGGSASAEAVVPRPRRGLIVDRRLRFGVILLVAAMIITGGGVALTSLLNHSTPSAGPPPESIIQIDGRTGQATGLAVPTSHRGDALAIGSGSIWEISYSARTLSRIDPQTGKEDSRGLQSNAPPVGLATGPDSVWVTTAFGDDSLSRFDTKTQQWDPPIHIASGLYGVAYGANYVWVADKADNLVERIDPQTSAITRIPVGDGPEAIAASSTSVWVANALADTISRIDPVSAKVQATIALRGTPSALAIGAGAVWVVSEATSRLVRIDPSTNSAVEVPFQTGPSALAASGSDVWVAEGQSGRILRIDAKSFKVLATVVTGGTVDGIAADGRSVWATKHVLVDAPVRVAPVPRGGILRVAIPYWGPNEVLADLNPQPNALDPQIGGGTLTTEEILRCCLVRTLVSHVGRSYRDGGAELRPDLAVALPDVSADGLTWTFRLRPGLHYAPPMQRTEIIAQDFVRALQRDATVGGSTIYSIIQGFDAYANGNGNPSTIAGLEAPDKYTLVVHLNKPASDLPDRFALTESGPIPASPLDSKTPYGVATGHDSGYGRYLVASGPYMIRGSEKLDVSKVAETQAPVSGLQPGHALVLVRNPSWKASADPLRPAYVDEMHFTIGVSNDDAARLLDSGQVDLILNGTPPPQVMPWLVEKIQANPRLGHVYTHARDFQRAVEMNLAMPPFDDIHVRKAVNYILNKRALLEAHGGDLTGGIMTHYVLDSQENDALSGYDPYPTSDATGSLVLARQEMSQSRYDPGHTGMCTTPVCRHVMAATIPLSRFGLFGQLYGGFPRIGASIASDLSQIGITLDVQSTQAVRDMTGNPSAKIPLDLTLSLGANWSNASSNFSFDFASDAVGGSLVGATPDQLHDWGYSVASVPNVNSRINECMQLRERQMECWTALDVFVMEKIVPVAPYVTENVIDVVPARVVHYSYDQSSDAVALDQIAIKR